jgi:DNA (cytosine-5)-methyltransferase 1
MGGGQVMTLGSLFDGIGGWLIAAKHAGVEPVWASEIDDFPAAVTAHHFPEVKQMGDITKIDPDKLEPVDIVCAGSPCQDLSVAGKRAGLAGERSGLFVDAIRLVRRMRERTGKPRFFVWENVPGAFSSNKGLDFKAVLEEISQTEISMPPGGKWAPAGMVEWDGGSLAWRVIDAQYWGVPQRRKRIFLVADFAGQSAGEILFVEQGLHGDSSESEGPRQKAAGNARESVDSASGFKYKQGAKAGGIGYQNGKAPTLELSQNYAVYDMTHADEVMRPVNGDKSNCLNSRMGTGGNQVPVVAFAVNQRDEVRDLQGKAGALQAQPGMKQQTFCIAGNIIGRENQNGGHQMGVGKDVSFTLNTVDRHAVAVDVRNLRETDEISGTLQAKKTGGYSLNYQNPVRTDVITDNKSVRRLTPTECERLQGLPDGYTDIEFNGKPAPDSKRYKALGNGMAQPCADWVIKRIAEVCSQGA